MKVIFDYAIQSILLRDENPRSCDILREVYFQRTLITYTILLNLIESHLKRLLKNEFNLQKIWFPISTSWLYQRDFR